ncbi:MAG: glutaredoxin family protein [Chthoniobacter sp.]|uniref:glutaredoxin family protein n=1 Tax=Chthoniobacter sp. TaxID=2510640 RepID=UPI0032AE4C12
MKTLPVLLLVIGLPLAGYLNRDRLSEMWAKHNAAVAGEDVSAEPAAAGAQRGAAVAPNPAKEAQTRATAIYPGLAIPNSALNQKFVALYKEAQASDPALLARTDWPLTLAERAVVALGGKAMPRIAPVAVSARAQGKQVVMYTTSHCPYCKQAKTYLTQRGIPFREVDIEASGVGKLEYQRLGGNGVPLIMVGGTKVEGFDEKELNRLL